MKAFLVLIITLQLVITLKLKLISQLVLRLSLNQIKILV